MFDSDKLAAERDAGTVRIVCGLDAGRVDETKIEVSGVKARLYVNDAPQPELIVNDLKHGNSKGAVALWIGLGTEGYFANLRNSK